MTLSLTWTTNSHMARRTRDPTPEEICLRCQEVQAGWSEDTKLRRSGSDKPASKAPGVREYVVEIVDGKITVRPL